MRWFIFSFLFAANLAHAAEWVTLDSVPWQYDKTSLALTSSGKAQAWTRYRMVDAAIESIQSEYRRGRYPHDYSRYDYSLTLVEFNCSKKTYQFRRNTDYDSTGTPLGSFDASSTKVEEVIPDSIMEAVIVDLCKRLRRR